MTEILKKPDDNDKSATNPWEGLGNDLIIADYGENGPVLGPMGAVDRQAGTVVPVEQNIVPGRARQTVTVRPEDGGPRTIRESGQFDITPQGRAVPRGHIR